MKEEPNYPSIDPELEARIVALVLGEASDFERDDLNRLIEERPELAPFKKDMQRVHGLLEDVGAGESVAEDDDWKLSSEKRNAVLAAISEEATEQPAIQLVSKSADQHRSTQRSILGNVAKIAAVLLVAGFFAGMMIPSINSARRQVASSETQALDSGAEFLMGEDSAPALKRLMTDGAVTAAADEEHWLAEEATTIEEPGYDNSSKSALSAIRETLSADAAQRSPDYLMDDVQYFPARPEFDQPSEGVSGPGPSPPTADDLALIPHGSEGGGTVLPKDSVAWREPIQSRSGLRSDRESETDGEDESEPRAGMGMGGGSVAKGKPESPPELAMPMLDPPERGQGQAASQGLTRGTKLGYALDPPKDSPVAGKEMDVAGAARTGEGREGGVLGGERLPVKGIAAGETPSNEVSSESMPGLAERDLSDLLGDVEINKAAPAKPMAAGIGGGKKDAEVASEYEDFDTAIPADSIPSPTNKPMSSSEDFKNKEVADRFKEDFAKERLAMPSDQGIALREGRVLDEGEPNGRQIPAPVTGTVTGQPRGQLRFGQANQDGQRGYGAQAKTPQEGPAGLNKRSYNALPNAYREKVETYGQRIASQPEEESELLGQQDQQAVNERQRGFWYVPPKPMFEDDYESKTRAPVEKTVAPAGLNEKNAEDEAFSTFSLHVSDVSFKLARVALASGSWPEPAKVRIEEFVNAFDYGDPMPNQTEKVACRVEQCIHPFLQQRNLLRVSMRTAAAGRSSSTPLRLTLLLDNSGSMERIDRQQTVRRAFALLAQQLKPIDQVNLISFSRQPRLLADKVSGAQSQQLVGLIENLPSEGGTNIEAALQLAFEKAQEQQLDNAQNRIILLTDGAVNLGDANPESLARMITTMRGAGIAFDAAGISAEGLNDEILEALTRKGDGRYYLLDSLEAADDGFARQIAGALRPSAKNVKVQIEFNPNRVGRYKLLGFEKHRLKQEDFRNDKVDAAEMAAAEAGVAVYQFEAKPDGEGDVGSVSVRFRDVSTGQMIENCWPIPYQADAPRLDQAAPSLRIAASAALLAARLRAEAMGESVDLRTLSNLVAGLPDQDRIANRVGQLQQMIEQARQVSGK